MQVYITHGTLRHAALPSTPLPTPPPAALGGPHSLHPTACGAAASLSGWRGAVCSALTVTMRLIGPDLINALYPVVVERLRHPKEAVRKKAVMALHWFQSLDPSREGPLLGVDVDRHFRTMLCDKVGGRAAGRCARRARGCVGRAAGKAGQGRGMAHAGGRGAGAAWVGCQRGVRWCGGPTLLYLCLAHSQLASCPEDAAMSAARRSCSPPSCRPAPPRPPPMSPQRRDGDEHHLPSAPAAGPRTHPRTRTRPPCRPTPLPPCPRTGILHPPPPPLPPSPARRP